MTEAKKSIFDDLDNELVRDSDEYLRKHRVLELFEVG
jgi:hypothetical protein